MLLLNHTEPQNGYFEPQAERVDFSLAGAEPQIRVVNHTKIKNVVQQNPAMARSASP